MVRGWRLPRIFQAVLVAGAALASSGRAQPAADVLEHGRYLATVGECAGCHTGAAGPFAGGRAFPSSFGVVESANITQDVETGIGAWSADDLYRALHEGRSKGGAHLYPAFPYPYFTRVTRADSDALYAFLRTVPAVRNAPRRDRLAFPMSWRPIMAFWNALYFRPGEFRPDPAHSPAWNRGAYLVKGLAHCGACHSPKNALAADSRSHPFEGGVIEGWFAPDLTGDPRSGLGSWSEDDLFTFLKTGRNPHTAAGGMMAGVVQGSISKLADDDLHAIAAYIKSLPPSAPQPAPRLDPAVMARGGAVYAAQCASCHEGGQNMPPPLQGAPNVQASNPTTLIRYLLNGTRTAITPAHPQPDVMPAMAATLDDRQTADVLSYIRNSWGNAASQVSPRQVAAVRAATAQAGG